MKPAQSKIKDLIVLNETGEDQDSIKYNGEKQAKWKKRQ